MSRPGKLQSKSAVLDLRIRTAFHEAGHVVASLALGRKVRSATIVPEAGRLGTVRTSRLRRLDPKASDRRMRMTIEREAIILLAGSVAEQLAGAGPHGGRGDRRDALLLVGFLSGSEAEERAYVRWLRERAKTLLCVHWKAVRAVARALLESERLDGAEVRAVAHRADPEI
jgi:ATP-dependent Zn protease